MKEKILIINDEPSIRELIALFLKQKEYEVIEASDGLSGITIAQEINPDLILLDVLMPGIDGYEVCKQLKHLPLTKDIPVIFLSSLSETKDKIHGLEVGGVDFIIRAEDRGELFARVQTHLKMRALNKALIERNQLLTEKQRHLHEDLAAAAEIQRSLLPKEGLKIPHIDFSWQFFPSEFVCGDIFNIIPIDPNHTAFYIIDVSGHGVSAAMITVSVSQYLHFLKTNFSNDFLSPKKIMTLLNKEFPFERFKNFFSLFYLILKTNTGTFLYCSAGHPPALLLSPQHSVQTLSTNGTVIGAETSYLYTEKTGQLKSGDKIILYSDGVIEYQNNQGLFFGKERLYEIVEANKNESIETLLITIKNALRNFGKGELQIDDLSLLGIQFNK